MPRKRKKQDAEKEFHYVLRNAQRKRIAPPRVPGAPKTLRTFGRDLGHALQRLAGEASEASEIHVWEAHPIAASITVLPRLRLIGKPKSVPEKK